MAIYIPMRKTYEDDATVVYEFVQEVWGPDPDHAGRERVVERQVGEGVLDKVTGEVVFLAEVPRQEFFGPRVARRLKRAFEAREYPEEMGYSA